MRRIAKLLSWSRYRRCRLAFHRPLAAHVNLSGVRRAPFALDFRSGGPLAIDRYRRLRWLWDHLLADPDRVRSLRTAGGMVLFDHEGHDVALRPEPGDFAVFREIVLDDPYELATAPAPLDTVVDLGANIGLFSIRAARCARRVVAVEPVAGNRRVARFNLDRSGVADRVTLLPNAVGATSGDTLRIFKSAAAGTTHSAFATLARTGTGSDAEDAYEDAVTLSLADLLDREAIDRVDLLKCDVEGAEYDALLPLRDGVLARIDRIAMEAHLMPEIPAEKLDALRAKLTRAGFRLREIPLKPQGMVKPVMIHATRSPPRSRCPPPAPHRDG